MNGRVYDPTLGRFLSVDPVFQFPTNTQSLNPYSYVLNNPLSLTDPTGYAADCGASSACNNDNKAQQNQSSQGYGKGGGESSRIAEGKKSATGMKFSAAVRALGNFIKNNILFMSPVAILGLSALHDGLLKNGAQGLQGSNDAQNKPADSAGIGTSNNVSRLQSGNQTLAGETTDFEKDVIHPALAALGEKYDSSSAESLLTGTAIVESDLVRRTQVGGGPALGLFQMEPNTAKDLWSNYLPHHPDLFSSVKGLMSSPSANYLTEIRTNDEFAAAMARVKYLTIKASLPEAGNVHQESIYWRKYYNGSSKNGKTASEFESKVNYWEQH